MDEESDTLRCEVKIDQRPIRLVEALLECWYYSQSIALNTRPWLERFMCWKV